MFGFLGPIDPRLPQTPELLGENGPPAPADPPDSGKPRPGSPPDSGRPRLQDHQCRLRDHLYGCRGGNRFKKRESEICKKTLLIS